MDETLVQVDLRVLLHMRRQYVEPFIGWVKRNGNGFHYGVTPAGLRLELRATEALAHEDLKRERRNREQGTDQG